MMLYPHLFVVCRHEDLKNMLDSSKDSQKLDAMKLIVGVRTICPCVLYIIILE